MRSHTCLALGFLAASAAISCGSDDRDPDVVTPFTGPTQQPGNTNTPAQETPANPDTTGGMQAGNETDPVGAADPAMSSGGTSNEGGPDVSQLDPSQSPPSDNGGGEQPPQNAGGAGGTAATGGTGGAGGTGPTEPEPPAGRTQVFLLFGQSNMWGVPNPQQEDLAINPRVEVLTLNTCGGTAANTWVPAQPPLHGCPGQPGNGNQGPGVGPGDYFAKTLADAFPDDTILLVPNAIPGVSIDVFQPGQQAYNSIVSRARMAQERGEIRGMIFHQGETDSGQQNWPGRVKTVVDRLRSDLQIGEVPFVAGELLIGGCCTGHNTLINQLPNQITNAAIARANGFTPLPNDGFGNLHFDLTSQREFGRRYGAAMLDLLEP